MIAVVELMTVTVYLIVAIVNMVTMTVYLVTALVEMKSYSVPSDSSSGSVDIH
jgi:hypothetical protein